MTYTTNYSRTVVVDTSLLNVPNTSLLNVPSACPHAADYVDHLNVHRVGKHDDHSAAVVNVPAPVIL